MSGIKVDLKGALLKTQALKNIPRATKYQVTKWAAETVKDIKRSAADMKTGARRGRQKTGQLARNVGVDISVGEESYSVVIGTGLSGSKEVVYARILDKGGVIKPKRAKYLTVPCEGVMGKAANFPDSFVIKSKRGNLLIVQGDGKGGIRPLFLLKKQVTIPAFNWFTYPLNKKIPLLNEMTAKERVLAKAQEMAKAKLGGA